MPRRWVIGCLLWVQSFICVLYVIFVLYRYCILYDCILNSLWPSGTVWWHRSGSTLAQVMACCLTAPSHYQNQCWLIISKVQWHSSEGNSTIDTSPINHSNYLGKYSPKISFKCPRSQWVNSSPPSGVYMHWWTGSALVQIMACCLFSAKSLPEPMLVYCQLDP